MFAHAGQHGWTVNVLPEGSAGVYVYNVTDSGMNILYLAHSHIPSGSANSIQVMNMCQAFQKNHQVTLFAQYTGGSTNFLSGVFEYYGISEPFEIINTFGSKSGSLNSLQNYWLLLNILKRRKFDLCFGRHTKRLAMAAYFGLPVIFEVHDQPKNYQEQYLIRKIYTRKNFQGLVCISEILRKTYLGLFPDLPEEKTIVAPSGINLKHIDSITPQDIQIAGKEGAFKAGYVGGLHPEKGIELILRIARLMPDIEFHLVGGRDQEAAFWKNKGKDMSNVFFYEQVNPVKAIQYRKAFDLLLAPYQQLSWTKNKGRLGIVRDNQKIIINSPLKYREYMAAEKPVITSDITMAREIFAHGQDALLLDPEDPEVWAQWIITLRDNKALCRNLARNARLKAEEYTWEKRIGKILDGL